MTGKGSDARRDYTPMIVALGPVQSHRRPRQVDKDRFPDITDLKGSSQIEQDADVILFTHRHKASPARTSGST